jgi:tRNA (adenine57-N1/adenine58-N1)-methyltransferase
MSFCKQNIEIGENDTVIMYMTFNEMRPTVIKRGSMFHSKYGSVKHVDLIGKKFGSRVVTNSGGRIYALQPTPELWTLCLPHRTQIIYTPNISMITLELEIKPGSIVIESGTGSASLSHALVRTIFPTGHLHTFEFHSERADTARKEFQVSFFKFPKFLIHIVSQLRSFNLNISNKNFHRFV